MRIDSILGGRKDWKKAIATTAIAIVVIVIIIVAGVGVYYYSVQKTTSQTSSSSENTTSSTSTTMGPQTTSQASNNVVEYPNSSPMTTLDPSTEFSNSIVILPNVYETLTYYNASTGGLDPLLAVNWTSSNGGLTWTFNLRQGVLFHDDTPFNSTAVVYSLNRTMTIGGGAAYIWAPVQSVVATGTYSVQFNLTYAANLPLIASAGYAAYMISPNIVSIYHPSGNISDWFNAGHDDGTGPYTVQSWNPQTQVVLTKFNDYWKGWGSNQFSTVVISIISDSNTRVQMAQSSLAIDYLVPQADVANLNKSGSGVTMYIGPAFQNLIAFYNNAKPPLNNQLVREALSYAIPYQQIVDNVMEGFATQSTGPIPAGMWGHNSSLYQYNFSLTLAKSLLAEAGYNSSHPLPALTMTYASGDPNEQGFAQLWAQNLQTIGVTLNTEAMVWTSQWALGTGNASVAQDIFVMYWWPTYPTPYDWLVNLFHSSNTTLFNLAYYDNHTFDNLIDTAASIEGTQPAQANQMYSQAQSMLISQSVAAFIFDEKYVIAVNSGIKGFSYNPGYTTVVWFYDLHT